MKRGEIYDIVYDNLFSTYFDHLPPGIQRVYFKPAFWQKLHAVFKAVLYDIQQSLSWKSPPEPAVGKIWIVVDAINNLQSVEYILARTTDFELVTTSLSLPHSQPQVKYLPSGFRFRFLFSMLIYVIRNKDRVRNRWDFFMQECGWYELALNQLRKYKPTSILFTNDHTPVNRAKMLAAKKMGIKTGYVQHACVRDDFGELLVDFAFLDGQDSVDKYARHIKKFDCKMFLIGMPRFTPFLSLRKSRSAIKVIGLAYNTTDSIQEIDSLVAKLSGYEVIIRPHPKDSRKPNDQANIKLSDSTKENVAHFIKNIDALVAGESAIHLEAILLNIPSFLYDFNSESKIRDLYGFERQGLVKRYTDSTELLSAIESYSQNPFDVYMRAGYYNSMVGNSEESASDWLAFELIRSNLFLA